MVTFIMYKDCLFSDNQKKAFHANTHCALWVPGPACIAYFDIRRFRSESNLRHNKNACSFQ